MPPRRPLLKPGLRRVWRDSATLQLGVDPRHAVVIGGLDPAAAGVIESLDGTRDLDGVSARAARLGVDRGRLDELLGVLARSGVLADGASGGRALGVGLAERDRLAPDAAAASLLPGAGDGVARLAGRRRSVVQVVGAGRVGCSVVTLLAAAAVGAVVVEDAGLVQDTDLAPGGARTDDVGARRQDAAVRAARRLAPSMRCTLPAGRRGPDLVVLCPPPGTEPAPPDALVRAGTPHLVARVRETTGVVGPLVVPGASSCLRCHDLHRADRDPAWPRIAAQLARARPADAPCDTVLAAAVAAHAALQVLAWLDGDAAPPARDGTLEIAQADGRVRRRSWQPHPACGCTWRQHTGGATPAERAAPG